MIFLMILMFLFAWTPYSVLALLEQFGPHQTVINLCIKYVFEISKLIEFV